MMSKKYLSMLLGGTLTYMVVSVLLMSDSVIAGAVVGPDAVAGATLVTPLYSLAAFFGSVISLGVPNLSRLICKSTDIRKHYLISSAMGVGLLLITFLVVKYVNFGIYLPISATMAILALPLMAIIFIKK